MIDIDGIRRVVVKGLSQHLNIDVIKSNQTGKIPEYPYGSYTITTLKSKNNGTWGEYSDSIDRKPFTQTWSITIQSDNESQATELALRAHEWFDHIGNTYLNDNRIMVQSVSSINNRDNMITIEYEYRKGFDVVFWLLSEIENPVEETGYIESIDLNGEMVDGGKSTEEQLEEELNEAVSIIKTQNNALSRLKDRIEGVESDE